jgi:hypothetical protein
MLETHFMFSLKAGYFFSTRRAFRPPAFLCWLQLKEIPSFRLAEQAWSSTCATEQYFMDKTKLPCLYKRIPIVETILEGFNRRHPVVFFNIYKVFFIHNTTSTIYSIVHSLGYMFQFRWSILRPAFVIWRYIQCVHTLWVPYCLHE